MTPLSGEVRTAPVEAHDARCCYCLEAMGGTRRGRGVVGMVMRSRAVGRRTVHDYAGVSLGCAASLSRATA